MTIFVNHKLIETFNFPGGECHVRIVPESISKETTVLAHLNNSNDIMCLILIIDAIRRINQKTDIHLTIPYFPYGRQDRVCNPGEALSVKVMADIINNLHCASVTIYDPHSDVTSALLNNCKVITIADIIAKSILEKEIHEKNMILVSPDAGAEKKIQAVAKKISNAGKPIHILYGRKTRELATGRIVATEIQGQVENNSCVILDDICDGGKTFIEIARVLKNDGAKNIYLYVTHGIFSKGLDVLREYFTHIYCLNTFLSEKQIDKKLLTILGDLQ